MFLAEADGLANGENTDAKLLETIGEWQSFPPSLISDHRDRCCRLAQEWLLAMDYSHLNAGDALTGPRWIRQRYTWGPTRWPIFWCEALESSVLDCGALAALAQTVLLGRGLRCYTAQLIQRYSAQDSEHWYCNWKHEEAEVRWIRNGLVYHEACAVVVRGAELRIWDPTASWWVNPKQFEGYGAVLAVRIVAPGALMGGHFAWGPHRIAPNHWQHLESVRADVSCSKAIP